MVNFSIHFYFFVRKQNLKLVMVLENYMINWLFVNKMWMATSYGPCLWISITYYIFKQKTSRWQEKMSQSLYIRIIDILHAVYLFSKINNTLSMYLWMKLIIIKGVLMVLFIDIYYRGCSWFTFHWKIQEVS